MPKAPALPQSEAPDAAAQDMTLKGRFARYDPPFLKLILPLLTTRYVWQAYEDINPRNWLDKPDPAKKPDFEAWKSPGAKGYIKRNIAALGMGATLLGVIGFYSKRTYDDIKTLYAEAVAYELDKKPQDVTWKNIFFDSKNAALAVTRDAFLKRTLVRSTAASAFLFPWQIFRDHQHAKPKYDANVNAGVGAVGTYLSLDGFIRKPSFFEAEQEMVGTKINHADTSAHEIIKPSSVESLILLQRSHLDKNYQWPPLSSAEGQKESAVATRIASLLNQTYKNTPKTEAANFTIGKLNFLIGFGMLDDVPASMAYVELANRSTDMKEVKAAAGAIKEGKNAKAVFAQFGIDLDNPTGKQPAPAIGEPPARSFTALAPKQEKQLAPRTPLDFATQLSDAQGQAL